ncbi:MAG: four-carbon acid sugar kinase family protein [Synergistaceae bacterium]|nr:four-carbon acid sugar kinase family protein [Synergistaceae bacterium]
MLQLLIIADDFTGALDTGVQFSALGAKSLVVTEPDYDLKNAEGIDVLIFDSETRHVDPKKAYKTVYDFVKQAKTLNIPHIYKKTDSGLRGNIGAELAGAMDALGLDEMSFVPAFPAMRRVTRGGVHYVDGVPVAESMFGRDPFEPVRHSDVNEIITSQTDKKGIHVYDAETYGDMIAIAGRLGHSGLRLTAGCAGFAGVLAHVLGFHGKGGNVPEMPERFFMVCGSVNPVTCGQVKYARDNGFKYVCLSAEQKLSPTWPGSPECVETARKWLAEISGTNAILDANNPDEAAETEEYIRSHGLDIETVRVNISRAVTGAAMAMIDGGLDARIMCVGGDTLLALMGYAGVSELVPICEIERGVVLTSFVYKGKTYYIMTKSGGFGEEDLLVKLARNDTEEH